MRKMRSHFLWRILDIFKGERYDEAACTRILFDRSKPIAERAAAAESLYTGQTSTAAAALLKVVLDDAEDPQLREEAATTLGSMYNVKGIDHDTVKNVPSPYREEILANITRCSSRASLKDSKS